MFLTLALAFIDDDSQRDLFVVLYDKHRVSMLNYANSLLKHKASQYAEEAVQDAFLSIAKNMSSLQSIAPERRLSYISCVVRNKVYDIFRRTSHASEVDLGDLETILVSDEPPVVERIISDEGYNDLKDCISSLDATYRDVLELKLLHKLPDPEIASILNINVKNVSMRIFRGKAKLREMISQKGE